ncbi:hypothetical protein P9K31_03165 [Corynebacterium glutamicum]|uniref:hypothetical protein n=1 Tax=Corynebacterium TaxID=1716 RepID=UPI000231B37F|nr:MULTISPECIES: hypothetical protein [Corynebacterium]ANR63310.1 hypothetical protein C628_11985 [[Brevibacterium] flavum ZL-1]ANR66315.1 hypothetical protein C627_11875 [Corynebacterium glutamicum ZL-6]PST75173.1 hypothetical protein I919_12023 [Corynebacterium glutamicum ZL-2]QJS14791.1 hypothetical protein HK412_10530 [Corynebacterium glutamicum]QXU47374.1 hypothetical protein KW808_12490 [[Brevibacterium] flavum]
MNISVWVSRWEVISQESHQLTELLREALIRINVTLASQVSPEVCAAYNIGYADPDTLVVEHAGEILHRLANRRSV